MFFYGRPCDICDNRQQQLYMVPHCQILQANFSTLKVWPAVDTGSVTIFYLLVYSIRFSVLIQFFVPELFNDLLGRTTSRFLSRRLCILTWKLQEHSPPCMPLDSLGGTNQYYSFHTPDYRCSFALLLDSDINFSSLSSCCRDGRIACILSSLWERVIS